MTNISVDPLNPVYRSVDGVLFDQSLTHLIRCPGGFSGLYAISSTLTTLGAGAFYDCFALTNVTMPASITRIGDFAFNDCTDLAALAVGDGVTSSGAAAFSQCSALTNVTIGKSVMNIGDSAFYGRYRSCQSAAQ